VHGIRRRSIRFRLTAWYACILAIAIAGFAFATFAILSRQLDTNADEKLASTALSIQQNSRISAREGELVLETPPLDPFRIAGFFVEGYQYPISVGSGPSVFYKSNNLGDYDLPIRTETKNEHGVDFFTTTIGGEKIRAAKVEAFVPNTNVSIGQVVVAVSTSQIDHTIEQLKTTILFGSIAAIIFAVMGGWFLAGRALRPVERMRQEAREIAEEGSPGILLAERIDDPGTEDELSRLAQTFNSLLERIEQAFANERRFIADASHELRTPLTAIRGNVDVLLMQARRAPDSSPEQIEALEDAQREIGRMGRLLEDLLMLARADAALHEPVGAPPVIAIAEETRRAIRTAEALSPGRSIVLESHVNPQVAADPDRLQQIVLILLDNAIRHSASDSSITISITEQNQDAVLAVADRGEGIDAEHLGHIFERFYRADGARARSRGGTGLGLSIAQALVRQLGGDISAASTPGEGSTFSVRIPLAPIAPDD
jgi:heavy metal sensor kinase